MKELYIYGAGPIARETVKLVNKINSKKKIWKIKGIVCKNIADSNSIDGIRLIDQDKVKKSLNTYAICAISDPIIKKKVVREIKKKKIKITKLICPEIFIYNDVKIGNGSIILSNSQIGFSTNIGENVLISFGVDVGHDVIIGNETTILPNSNIGGYTEVSNGTILGAGVNVMPKLKIGSNSRIGMGVTIMKNIGKNLSVIMSQKNIILTRKPT